MDYVYQGCHPPSQFAAMVASHHFVNDATHWYTNTGATDHITLDINNLTLRSDYLAGLHISYIGSSPFPPLPVHFVFLICYMFLI